jgi:hypothetical protein
MLRLTLGFNEDDFNQYEAYKILKSRGRKISKYIAELVLKEQNQKDIKELIEKTIREELSNIEIQQTSSKNERNKKTDNKTNVDKTDNSLPENFLESDTDIVNSILSGFPGLED